MAAAIRQSSNATIVFYYPGSTNLDVIENEEFFSRPGEGLYDTIGTAFRKGKPFIYTKESGSLEALHTSRAIYNLRNCTACVCKDTSKKIEETVNFKTSARSIAA